MSKRVPTLQQQAARARFTREARQEATRREEREKSSIEAFRYAKAVRDSRRK
jgi:hypothetical protein